MNYSNITGFILFVSLIIQFFSGLLSSSYYEDYVVPRPDPAGVCCYIRNHTYFM